MGEFYKNRKNGKVYEILSFNIKNSTNLNDGQIMVLYIGELDNNTKKILCVREINEFHEKFVKI